MQQEAKTMQRRFKRLVAGLLLGLALALGAEGAAQLAQPQPAPSVACGLGGCSGTGGGGWLHHGKLGDWWFLPPA
jgi:hypothetical protein